MGLLIWTNIIVTAQTWQFNFKLSQHLFFLPQLLARAEHWAVFGILDGFGFGKSIEILKTQTQNRPKKFWAVSVLVYRFWAVYQKQKKRSIMDFELFLRKRNIT